MPITIKPPVVLTKSIDGSQLIAAPQIEMEGGRCTARAETKCEGVLSWPSSCNGRHGRDVSLPRVTVPFNRWLGDSRGSVMGNVLSLQRARERAWQSVSTGPGGGNAGNQRLLERLEAE